MSLISRISELKIKHEKSKEKEAKLKGQRTQLMKRLATDYNIKTVAKAEIELDKLETSIDKLESKLEKRVSALEEKIH